MADQEKLTQVRAGLETEEGARELLDHVTDRARLIFEKDGYVQPAFFVMHWRDPDTGVELDKPGIMLVGTDMMGTSEEKDVLSLMLKVLAHKSAAFAIAQIMETWTLGIGVDEKITPDEARRLVAKYEAWRRQNPEASLEEYEGATEAVYVFVEHARTGPMTMCAGIDRNEDGTGVLREFRALPGMLDGRFANILPTSAYGQTQEA